MLKENVKRYAVYSYQFIEYTLLQKFVINTRRAIGIMAIKNNTSESCHHHNNNKIIIITHATVVLHLSRTVSSTKGDFVMLSLQSEP